MNTHPPTVGRGSTLADSFTAGLTFSETVDTYVLTYRQDGEKEDAMKSLIIGLVAAALSLSPASGWQRDGSFVNERDYIVATHDKWVSIDDGSSIAPFDETTDINVGDLIAHYTRYEDGEEVESWDVTVDHVSLV